MKQYYQFMLHEVLDDLQKIDYNIDSFEEDLHKMLMVSSKKGNIFGVLVNVLALLCYQYKSVIYLPDSRSWDHF